MSASAQCSSDLSSSTGMGLTIISVSTSSSISSRRCKGSGKITLASATLRPGIR
ncbi:hypothetical protein N9C85_01335 [Synechococcus sp. AH-224-I15]|uniref:hypothetical protein n=1 Tax=Synechococcus sp. SYN20 TaxID=1050714 RepID=UPI0021084EC7|nr:hypothetical protein [Synechococcus sp. SYN20]MDA9868056.1 hypothetical protein [Synechococcus sp. AH-224-I15]